jgi:hypothetical protein
VAEAKEGSSRREFEEGDRRGRSKREIKEGDRGRRSKMEVADGDRARRSSREIEEWRWPHSVETVAASLQEGDGALTRLGRLDMAIN